MIITFDWPPGRKRFRSRDRTFDECDNGLRGMMRCIVRRTNLSSKKLFRNAQASAEEAMRPSPPTSNGIFHHEERRILTYRRLQMRVFGMPSVLSSNATTADAASSGLLRRFVGALA